MARTAARELCDSLLSFKPRYQPQAIRGAITLRIVLSDTDYKKYKKRSNLPEEAGAHFERIPLGGPLIIMPKSSVPEKRNSDDLVVHEVQHALNDLENRTFIELAYRLPLPDSFPLPGNTIKDLNRLESERYHSFKDEFLAHMTLVSSYHQFNPNRIPDYIKWFEERILAGELVNDVDWKTQVQNGNEGIETLVRDSTKAFFEAFTLFTNIGYDINSSRIAINFLSQFPVGKWPAAVRLLKSKQKDLSGVMNQEAS